MGTVVTIHEEYEQRRNSNCCLSTSSENESWNSSVLTISLLNIRSLRKHSIDIKLHLQLFNSDDLALTETQLLPNDSDIEITENLKPFTIYCQDHNSDKYSSMAVCIRDSLQMEEYEYLPLLNVLRFLSTLNYKNHDHSFCYIEKTIATQTCHNIWKHWNMSLKGQCHGTDWLK